MPEIKPEHIERIRNSKAVAIGCSAGGFMPMQKLLSGVSARTGIPFFLVIHRNIKFKSRIVGLLSGITALQCSEPEDKDPIIADNLYIAPAGYHMMVEGTDLIALDVSEPVMFCRPAIDITFESLADAYKDGLTLFLLSGANADGAAGMRYAHTNGAFTIVQDPEEAEFSAMPGAAVKLNAADLVCTTDEMQQLLRTLVDSRKT